MVFWTKVVSMASLKVNKRSLSGYFGYLRNLDESSKMRLIEELSASQKSSKKTPGEVSHLYGAWEDDKSAEDIILTIQSLRRFGRDLANFE